MAEESIANELEGVENQLHSLLSRCSGDEFRIDSELFCSDFCKLVEEFTSHWQVPLPQLRILEIALCYFAQASTLFSSNCDHVHRTVSRLALSVFELLLFFDQKDFHQEPLKHFTATFHECYLVLAKYHNVPLLQMESLVQGGGPWTSPALQAILSESSLPQNEVDDYVSSELPVFLEFRVRYLLSCGYTNEAMALARSCFRHPTAGKNLFILQVYLSWLCRSSQHEQLRKEVTGINGKDAVHIICSLECEEKDEFLLALSSAFLSEQLQRGDMYCLCDLVLVWASLHRRLSTTKQTLLRECHQLMQSTTNVKSIFPFIRAILQEMGEEGIQFCVELCANALQSCLPCDVLTKSLIYKTIAGLLPDDLEVCRACALLVFFLEQTVESYKIVYLLYMHPDQEYQMDDSPIKNNVRFETLQVLKKDLYFDPELWNLIALRTNCLKLMSEKVVSTALEEIMEDKWISKYFTKEPTLPSSRSACRRGNRRELNAAAKRRHQKEESETASKRLKMGIDRKRKNDHAVRKKGNQGFRDSTSGPLRRSFWQLDRIHSNVAQRFDEHRRTTRLSEKNPPKRRIRKPKWLLEDSGTLEENVPVKIKKNGLKQAKHFRSRVMKRSETGPIKNNSKLKPLANSHLKSRENDKHRNGFSANSPVPSTPPQIILELSLPDNELMDTFTEEACSRKRGFPQVLLYKPMLKLPDNSQPAKTVHRKEVVLRARDETMFIQQIHCYTRRQKGKGSAMNVQGSVSTITRSSVQGSPPKDHCQNAKLEEKAGAVSQTREAAPLSRFSDKILKAQNTKTLSRRTSSARRLSERSAAEIKVVPNGTEADDVTNFPDSSRIPEAKRLEVTQSSTCARDDSENLSAEQSQILAAAEVNEDANLNEAPAPQTVPLAREPPEEPAVEMKVTIASQSSVLDKVSKNSAVEDLSKAQVSQTVRTKRKASGETHPAPINANVSHTESPDFIPSHPQDFVFRSGDQQPKPLPTRDEDGKGGDTVRSSESTTEVTESLPEKAKGHLSCKNETSPTQSKPSETESSHIPTEEGGLCDISALTLVTEMVTELAPEQLAQDQESSMLPSPGNSVFKDLKGVSSPKGLPKIRTISSCSTPEETDSSVSSQRTKGRARALDNSDMPENSEPMETVPETEESKLEFCCTFCNKVFKGSRVVAHAMFHFRKDECMFCGVMFRDDLLAMMHMSDHIEKLKRSKETQTSNKEHEASDSKDTCTHKNSAKANTTSMTPGCRSRGKLRKSAVCADTMSTPDVSPSESRTLRSKDREGSATSLREKLNPAKAKTAARRVNGHIGKKESAKQKKDSNTKQETQQQDLRDSKDVEMNSSPSVPADKSFVCSKDDAKKKTGSQHSLKTASKQKEGEAAEPQESVSCPLDGCSWFKDLSKNRVALLYHALDDHYGEVEPLELAFRVGNSKCSICMRVLMSFEHFQHHVERHRLTPRHPCLHRGCTARFKTGMEMRRHSRKHSPLQATCCLPGCSQLFICLWALNLHERDHYTSKSAQPGDNTDIQAGDKSCKTPVGKNRQSSEDFSVPTAEERTEGAKAACRFKNQRRPRKKVMAPLSAYTFLIKKEPKGRATSTDSHKVKNVSKKDKFSQLAVSNVESRQALRKAQVKNPTPAAIGAHRVISSTLQKHNRRKDQNLKQKQSKGHMKGLKRKGRPPKLNRPGHDENTSDQKRPPSEIKIVTTSNKIKVEKEKTLQLKDESKSTTKSKDESETKIPEGRQITRNQEPNVPSPTRFKPSRPSELKTQKKNSKTEMKLHKKKNHCMPSDSRKPAKHKEKSKKATRKERHKQESSAEQQVETRGAEMEGLDDGKSERENTSSTQSDSGNCLLSIPPEVSDVPPTPEKTDQEPIDAKEGKDRAGKAKTSKKSAQLQPEDEGAEESVAGAEERASKGLLASAASTPADILNCASISPEDNKREVHQKEKSKVTKAAEVGVTTKKLKDKTKKAVKKKQQDHQSSLTNPVKSADVQPEPEKGSAGAAAPAEAAPSETAGCSLTVNGQEPGEDPTSKESAAEYRKRPYMRPPPTAYLDEKFITMPKRRKETAASLPSHGGAPPGQACAAEALQRRRCAKCFATFSCAEELQSHLQLQKCSNLFGFDSDDEGNG
ncbi:uncharacterized protein ACNS7B_014961 [Menidia menidia]